MKQPLISICIPTYNGSAFIGEALDSAISQSYTNLEIIISDDASKDDTLKVIETYHSKTDIPIYIYHHQPNGIGANWNNTIKYANGEYIKFLFQDDVLNPNCIKEMVSVFLQNTNLGLVACKREFIVEDPISDEIKEWINRFKNLQMQFENNEEIAIIDNRLFSRRDFLDSPMNKIGEPPTVLFKKSIIDKVGFFDEELKQILDYVFYYRILKKHPIAIINKPLVMFRIHNKQATNVNRNQPITDYEIYRRILYKEFFKLLHPTHKKKLALKFSYTAKLKFKIKRVLKKIRK